MQEQDVKRTVCDFSISSYAPAPYNILRSIEVFPTGFVQDFVSR